MFGFAELPQAGRRDRRHTSATSTSASSAACRTAPTRPTTPRISPRYYNPTAARLHGRRRWSTVASGTQCKHRDAGNFVDFSSQEPDTASGMLKGTLRRQRRAGRSAPKPVITAQNKVTTLHRAGALRRLLREPDHAQWARRTPTTRPATHAIDPNVRRRQRPARTRRSTATCGVRRTRWQREPGLRVRAVARLSERPARPDEQEQPEAACVLTADGNAGELGLLGQVLGSYNRNKVDQFLDQRLRRRRHDRRGPARRRRQPVRRADRRRHRRCCRTPR